VPACALDQDPGAQPRAVCPAAPKLTAAVWQVSAEAQRAAKAAGLPAPRSMSASMVGVGRANMGLSTASGAVTGLQRWVLLLLKKAGACVSMGVGSCLGLAFWKGNDKLSGSL